MKNLLKKDLLDLMRSRRSVRSYKPDPLPKEKIQAILEAGCLAPSAHNHQPWHFIVTTDRETINRLSFSAQNYLEKRAQASDAVNYFGSKERVDRIKKRLELKEDTVFYGAACLILVVVEKGNEYAPIDCGLMAENMCLYAKEQGIASCIIGYARYIDRLELLNVGMKQDQELMFGMVFGYEAMDSSQEQPDRDFNKVQKWIE
ncbi:MAG: nitroreductase family protein [Candidatus Gracilibacteria bacterium]|jgi:nitroreductase